MIYNGVSHVALELQKESVAHLVHSVVKPRIRSGKGGSVVAELRFPPRLRLFKHGTLFALSNVVFGNENDCLIDLKSKRKFTLSVLG